MNKEEKTIEFLIAHKNNLWTGLLVLTGGLAGLFLSFPISKEILAFETIPKAILFIGGCFFFSLTVKGLININEEIKQKLK